MEAKEQTPIERFRRFTHLGHPTCEDCYKMSPEARKATPGEFWPSPVITYVNADADAAVDFFARRTCAYHDTAAQVPDEATHQVVNDPEFIGSDPDELNSAYKPTVTEVTRL